MTSSHFSLDIETLDTRASAVVLSIGICKFDPNATNAVGPIDHVTLEVGAQIRNGRTVSSETFYWWAEQLVKMDKTPFPGPVEDVLTALEQIILFITDNCAPMEGASNYDRSFLDAYIWVRGPHFDWTILESLAAQVGLEWPVLYHRIRDQRTFCHGIDYVPPENHEVFVAHDARADAIKQAFHIQQNVKARHINLG